MRAPMLLVVSAGCAGTLRLEAGVHRTGDDEQVRIALSLGIGVGDATPTSIRSLTQSVGYRGLGETGAWTTTTRYLRSLGPIHASGGLELSSDGVAVLPAIQVPFLRRITCTYEDRCLTDASSPVEKAELYAAGVQLRIGHDDGELVTGADLVVSLESFSSLIDSRDD